MFSDTFRKKDVQSSLALVDLFGCVWVAGWKQVEAIYIFKYRIFFSLSVIVCCKYVNLVSKFG